jgi:hypothetical protein
VRSSAAWLSRVTTDPVAGQDYETVLSDLQSLIP